MIALTHRPSFRMQAAERTFVPRVEIDLAKAARQHAAYCRALECCGATVRVLDVNAQFPDAAFIEDTAVVLDEVAILCSMGAESRRGEPAGIEPILRQYRELVRILPPATVEGGDVLRTGRRLLVGQSCRTNAAGIAALADIAGRFGYFSVPIPVRGCLHLKTACTALPDGRLLVNLHWIDGGALAEYEMVRIPAGEPWAANIGLIGTTLLVPAAHPETAALLERLGFAVQAVDLSEFAKAEGGVTCLSILIR